MGRPLALALAVLGLGLRVLAAALYYAVSHWPQAVAPATTPVPPQRVAVVNGLTTVTLDVATQQRSGVEAKPLRAARWLVGTTHAFGTVLDLQPLIDLRNRYTTARNDAAAAQAVANASQQELARMKTLYEDRQNVSQKAYQAALSAYAVDRSKTDAAALAERNVQALADQQFGPVLARWIADDRSPEFDRLLRRADVLVRIALPSGSRGAPKVIEVQPIGSDRQRAEFVSVSAQADPSATGASMIYRVNAPIPTGTPVVAILPGDGQADEGVFVPASAVVWYAGQTWVYEQASPTAFARERLASPVEMDDGYFVREGLRPGERIVTRGAQLLLSEEQRPPPGGAACKDPECD